MHFLWVAFDPLWVEKSMNNSMLKIKIVRQAELRRTIVVVTEICIFLFQVLFLAMWRVCVGILQPASPIVWGWALQVTPQPHLQALEAFLVNGQHSGRWGLSSSIASLKPEGPYPASVAMATQEGTFLRSNAWWRI